MRRAIIAASLLVTSLANAEPRTIDIAASASYVVIGGGRNTGGLMPSIAWRWTWQARAADLSLGAHLGLFGFGGSPRWMGVLGGPTAAIAWHPRSAWTVGVGVDVDVGRLPVCNAWGLCLRYIGVFPAGSVGGAYVLANHVEATAALTVRAVSTLGWTGATFEPAAGARFFW